MTPEEWVQAVCNPPRPVIPADALPPPPTYVYCRVSTQDQADSGAGIEAQKDTGFRWCQFRRLNFQAYFVDEAVSSSQDLESRPAGQQLAVTLRPGDHVVFPKLDRGFRNTVDMLQTVERWLDKGVTCHFVDLGMDTSSPAWLLLATVQSAFARAERDRIRERTAMALAAIRRQGKRVNIQPPTGFRFVPDRERKGKTRQGNAPKKLEYWPEAIEFMKFIVYLHDIEGMSFLAITKYVKANQIKDPRGIVLSRRSLTKHYETHKKYEQIKKDREEQP